MDPLDDLLDDEDTDKSKPDDKGNAAFAEMRKTNKLLQKELEELKAFKAEREKQDRANAISNVFGEVGLNPKWAEFYQGEEATSDAIKAWAVDKGFIQVEEGEAPAAPAQTQGFTPTVVSEASVPTGKSYSVGEWREMAQANPRDAQRALVEGRVRGMRINTQTGQVEATAIGLG